jgi:ATP-binding cassette, subfamily G (WHITE), member 2, SNQ2
MLDILGTGNNANYGRDWHQTWMDSNEGQALENEILSIHAESSSRPPVAAPLRSDFATTWMYQFTALLQRNFTSYWRNPTYIISKLLLNIVGGSFIGFTFWKTDDTLQGTQNKLFVRLLSSPFFQILKINSQAIFMATVLCVPLGSQVQVPFINLRDIYEIREKPSRMYHRSALTTSQIVVELPWNILGSILFFLCWYWAVGFDTSRAGYTLVMYGILFPIWYTSFAQAVASMAPCKLFDIGCGRN